MKYHDWKWVRRREVAAVFCVLCIGILIYTWSGTIFIPAFIASIVSTICYWTNNAKMIRAANLFCASPCWLIYDIFIGFWGGVVNETITLTSILVSVYRFGWKAMGDSES